MKTIFKDVKGPEGSGSKAADEQTASVQAPQKNKLFDWVNVDFGLSSFIRVSSLIQLKI